MLVKEIHRRADRKYQLLASVLERIDLHILSAFRFKNVTLLNPLLAQGRMSASNYANIQGVAQLYLMDYRLVEVTNRLRKKYYCT